MNIKSLFVLTLALSGVDASFAQNHGQDLGLMPRPLPPTLNGTTPLTSKFKLTVKFQAGIKNKRSVEWVSDAYYKWYYFEWAISRKTHEPVSAIYYHDDLLFSPYITNHEILKHFGTDQIYKIPTLEIASLMKQKHDEFIKDYSPFAGSDVIAMPWNDDRAIVTAALYKLSFVTEESELNTVFNDLNTLTWKQKKDVVQLFGGIMPYDMDRQTAVLSPDARTIFDLINSIRTQTGGGVCRDTASAQAQMMTRLGFKDAYVIGYSARGGGHATTFARDPEDDQKLFLLNYERRSSSKMIQEIESIRPMDDISFNYYIFKPDGKTVAVLPSELGQVLHQEFGGNVRDLDPFTNLNQTSIQSAHLESDRFSTHAFRAQLKNGNEILGAGVQFKSKPNPYRRYHLEAATGLVQLKGTSTLQYIGDKSETYQINERAAQFYARGSGTYLSKDYSVLETEKGKTTVQIKNQSIMTTMATYTAADVLSKPGFSPNFDFRNNTEVQFNHQSKQQKTNVHSGVGLQTNFGLSDVRVNHISSVRILPTVGYAYAQTDTPLNSRHTLLTLTQAGVRKFGPQANVQLGLHNQKSGFTVMGGYQGTLKKNALTIAPNTVPAAVATVRYQKRNLTADVNAQVPFKDPNQGFVTGRVAYTFGLKRKNK